MKTATYTSGDKPLVVEYDETAPCRICGLPVEEASMGGTDVCPWCDCGNNRDGTKWTWQQYNQYVQKARSATAKEDDELSGCVEG